VVRDAKGFVVAGPDLLVGGERPRGWSLDRPPYPWRPACPAYTWPATCEPSRPSGWPRRSARGHGRHAGTPLPGEAMSGYSSRSSPPSRRARAPGLGSTSPGASWWTSTTGMFGWSRPPAVPGSGDLAASAARHEQALELYRSLGDLAGEAQALIELGAVQSGDMNYQAATVSLTRALQLSRDLGNRPREANALKNLGAVECRTGNYQAAAATLTRALELFRDLGHCPGQADTYAHLGLVHRLSAIPVGRPRTPALRGVPYMSG
jgi:hypothetical protein